MLLGIILGALLTIAGAYAYDSSTDRATNGLTATSVGGQAPVVNWNVVNFHWNNLQGRVRSSADSLERSLKRHTG